MARGAVKSGVRLSVLGVRLKRKMALACSVPSRCSPCLRGESLGALAAALEIKSHPRCEAALSSPQCLARWQGAWFEWREDKENPWAETAQGTVGQADRGTAEALSSRHSCLVSCSGANDGW